MREREFRNYGKFDPFYNVPQKKEYGFVKATLNADLSPLFHWNTKQIYVAVLMEYNSEKFNKSEIIVWDDILFDKRQSKFVEYALENKYPITDIESSSSGTAGGIKGREVQFRIKWEVVPFFGWFARFESAPVIATFPNSFSKVK